MRALAALKLPRVLSAVIVESVEPQPISSETSTTPTPLCFEWKRQKKGHPEMANSSKTLIIHTEKRNPYYKKY